jgi:hypothetical protein
MYANFTAIKAGIYTIAFGDAGQVGPRSCQVLLQ